MKLYNVRDYLWLHYIMLLLYIVGMLTHTPSEWNNIHLCISAGFGFAAVLFAYLAIQNGQAKKSLCNKEALPDKPILSFYAEYYGEISTAAIALFIILLPLYKALGMRNLWESGTIDLLLLIVYIIFMLASIDIPIILHNRVKKYIAPHEHNSVAEIIESKYIHLLVLAVIFLVFTVLLSTCLLIF